MPSVQPGGDSAARGRRRRVASTLSEINVVPLVDVMLVLLIIFMVTAPMIQRGVDVRLPVAQRTTEISGLRVEVNVPAGYREKRRVYLGDEEIPVDVLQERVRQRLENSSDKKVYLKGDANILYQDLMGIIDRLRAAGVLDVGLVANPGTAEDR